MSDDAQLLTRFAKGGDEAAFRELVARHLDLVYAAALRQLNGDAHLAQDVAQTVFTDLARKARSLPRGVVLSGWLYEAARFAAAKVVRGEQRRRDREQEAAAMQDPTPESTPDWEQLRPVLDTAVGELSATDRNAVLLRFFERRDYRAVGAALGLSEDAAQKRVARALDQLRTKLTRRGVTLSASALAAAITTGAIHSAPAGLVVSVATVSLAGASATATAGATAGLSQIMATTKIKLIAAAVAAAAVGTPLVMQYRANEALRAENAALREQAAEAEPLRAENERLATRLKATAARPPADLEELRRLRSQVATLQQVTQENARLKTERDRLAKRLQQAAGEQADEPEEGMAPEKRAAIAKLNFAKQGGLALHMFAADNSGLLPTNFVAMGPYLNEASPPLAEAAKLGIKEDHYELVYPAGLRLADVKDPAMTILIREKQPFQTSNGKWARTYLFADGHSEVHSSDDGDFTAWEKERWPKQAPP